MSQSQTIFILTGRINNVSIGRPFAIGQRADILHGKLDDRRGNSIKVAVKVLRAVPYDDDGARQELRKSLESHLQVWCHLKHPNVVDFLGLSYDVPFPAAIILPFFKHGNSLDYIKNRKQEREREREKDRKEKEKDKKEEEKEESQEQFKDVLHLLRGAASGLKYLHAQSPPIVHADVRACNVLVDDNGNACLVDFGLVPVLSTTTFTTTNVVGPARWQAPEVFLTEDEERLPFTVKTDVFSFAMFTVELVTQDRPFSKRKIDTVVIVDITKNKRPTMPDNNTAAVTLWPLLDSWWAQAPDTRPDMSTVCEGLRAITID